jgi:menaquinone-9 beta-reductase
MQSPSPTVVIGGGPAGCAAALTLVRNGFFPLVVEKGLPGKDKACGDAWVPSAVQELQSLEIGKRELGSNWHPFSRLDGYYADRKVWSHELTPFEGVLARRAIVDQLLRDRVLAAGCEIWHHTRATDLRVLGRQIELTIRRGAETHILAPSAVVLASGSGCRFARQAALDGEAVLGASVSSYLPTDGDLASPTFLFGEPSPGYAWVFPMGANASNAGVCALLSGASGLRLQMKTLAARLGVSGAVCARGGLGALWSGRGTAWSHEAGIVSCGDAAGLVDPISGEGLTAALVSGKRAGAAIASLLSGEPGALAEYSGWVRDWGQARYAPSIESRILAAWVGLAPAERRLWALLAGARPSEKIASMREERKRPAPG